jgi:hypothetical protein
MTLPRLHAMTQYWMEHPPAHTGINAILTGLSGGPKKRKPLPAMDGESFPEPPRHIPEEIPLDSNGFPTKVSPAELGAAVGMLGGKVIKRNRTVN